ncbi:MAG: hypothetical protein EA387_15525 [Nitriliruptor sp.]|nr:MAG: hypothetical protein EA387_15525 [Nitriliruptor sp.]
MNAAPHAIAASNQTVDSCDTAVMPSDPTSRAATIRPAAHSGKRHPDTFHAATAPRSTGTSA